MPDKNKIKLSPHFTRGELNRGNEKKVTLQPVLIKKLEKLRRSAGKLTVTSGYRSAKHNAETPDSARLSRHVVGAAADIKSKTIKPRVLAKMAKRAGFSFIKTYSNRIHVDVQSPAIKKLIKSRVEEYERSRK